MAFYSPLAWPGVLPGLSDGSRPAVEPERDLHLVHWQLRLLQEQPTQLEGERLLAPSESKCQPFFTECSPSQPFTAQHVPEGKVYVYFWHFWKDSSNKILFRLRRHMGQFGGWFEQFQEFQDFGRRGIWKENKCIVLNKRKSVLPKKKKMSSFHL